MGYTCLSQKVAGKKVTERDVLWEHSGPLPFLVVPFSIHCAFPGPFLVPSSAADWAEPSPGNALGTEL